MTKHNKNEPNENKPNENKVETEVITSPEITPPPQEGTTPPPGGTPPEEGNIRVSVKIAKGKTVAKFFRCGHQFTKKAQFYEVDAATLQRLQADQMLEVSKCT